MTSDIRYPGCDPQSKAYQAAGSIRIERIDPIVRADSLEYILFNKEDLVRQAEFLVDFGMTIAKKTDAALYMRGVGPSPYFYAAYKFDRSRKGSSRAAQRGYIGIGFGVKSRAELELISETSGKDIESVDGPGGGSRVRLCDPDGFVVDVVHGRERAERLVSHAEPISLNTPFKKSRINETVRRPIQPAVLERLGHCVLSVSDFSASLGWYMRHVGLIPTDVQCLEDGTPALSFNRLDRGSELTDHHSLVLVQNVSAHYMHSAYESLDLDSIGQGQQYLSTKGWTHFWGIGRHILGSQIFDYWLDPEGDELEHYADGDVFDNGAPTNYHPLEIGGLWAWGADVPDMRPKITPRQMLHVIKAIRSGKLSTQRLGLIKKAMSSRPRPWAK